MVADRVSQGTRSDMSDRTTQLDPSKSTAPPPQHAPRPAQLKHLNRACTEEDFAHAQGPVYKNDARTLAVEHPVNGAPTHVATAGERDEKSRLLTVRDVAELLQVPVSWVYERTRGRSPSRIPGFRLGKYWRFSVADVTAWIKARRTNHYRDD
jgi:excisionase family DNA binding protein